MFDDGAAPPPAGSRLAGDALRAADVRRVVTALQHVDRDVTDAERIDLLRALEELKNAAAAAQARAAVAFDESQRAEQEARGVPARLRVRGTGAQVALVRRESPHRADRHLGLARALVHEMPHTLRAMELGVLSEWRATLIGRETACLEKAHRQAVDAELCRDADRVEALGDKRLVAEVRKLSYKLEPRSVVERARSSLADRRVTIRPAPDTMCYLTALLPVAEGVAAYASLTRAADRARAEGDERGKGAVMADTLVERLTGQSTAGVVPVSVGLIMTDAALLADADDPAHLEGYGPVPPRIARDLLTTATLENRSRTWLHRLYTSPATGQLVAVDSRSRRFPRGLARLIRDRDQWCRTPWCNAPIRHIDHAAPQAGGGATSASNGQGLCEACNHHKQAAGWRALPRPGPDHVVETTTPTGHQYRSRAPSLTDPRWTQFRPGVWTRVA